MAVRILAVVRIVNGTLALLVPGLLIGRLDPGREPSPAAVYAFRMFGIRTVLLGLQLLFADGDRLRYALREGALIHAVDAATAVTLGARRKVSVATAVFIIGISASNTALAAAALRTGKNRGACDDKT
ncbi:hypothetical protein FPZ12_040440 [Amycolatopsis acidicola]|uniref:DUF4267 domain-containing protein n=1 Tax=Amycolatopsis acidicola TaxID=2596893 RepID=A0A5N0UPS9_9PSEU|nr:hypothetical protein [Amycolatopsis acidicola]KAA9150789.1 hypothetical protein FPZ12_040440 [Amycolatopsis acidicola]